ncbi:uncharacterized protein LOC108219045 isoform X1 [Daucus carota subsp. sativus]|uniref:uncharacterized protein LOC108219045 isoform X1 n=1 Tax=Daucus carota subsp. sativus TaxID=79200 RepID=UPI0007EFEF98|nr:PREDICTED: uncharacterized protein LOC108219045 isoform X1 [Daucus carota subsp. sativus]
MDYTKSEENWSEEHDHLPLKQRLKILHANNKVSDLAIAASEFVVKKEDEECVVQDVDSAHFHVEGRIERFLLDESHCGRTRESCIPKIEQDISCQPNQTNAEAGCDNLSGSTVNCLVDRCSDEVKAIKSNSETPAYILDDLDHVDLKERWRMLLLSRKSLGATEPVCKEKTVLFLGQGTKEVSDVENSIELAANIAGGVQNAVIGKEDSYSVKEEYLSVGDSEKVPRGCTAVVCGDSNIESSHRIAAESASTNDICSSKITSGQHEPCGGKFVLSSSGKHFTVPITPSTTSVNVKVEPIENNELDEKILEYSLMTNLVAVKNEPITSDAFSEDDLDHMLLSTRIKLLTSRQIAKAEKVSEDSRKIEISSPDCEPISSKSDPPARVKRSRKRKKTATDSVEIALEEDAPGLLQVLVDKGVLIDEMKLYGQTEVDEAIDESFSEFSELETVISKLFSQRHSLIKLATLKGTKGEKISYCLACLISLVEQARYLQFRKWPVEWGWCRDLQSFIFVFERHKRIVLERPEYGYATYFFELVDSLSIDWQIKRLVTAMKLTSCSRISLIENRALTVGKDLTEGEAGVLSDYGWVPDTGLGTMLNYRDRVVHDRKNEADSSEWRSKIGNLLMDGYNGGTIVSTSIPKKFADKTVVHNPAIKLEI